MTDDRNQLLDALIAEHRRQAEFDPAVAALAINSVLVERPAAENAELLAIAISRLAAAPEASPDPWCGTVRIDTPAETRLIVNRAVPDGIRNRICAWLMANDIDPRQIPADVVIFASTDTISFDEGHRRPRMVPLLVPVPAAPWPKVIA